jgi:para-aminobenzoate synthetase component 1
MTEVDPERTLAWLTETLAEPNAAFFTLSYDFGSRLLGMGESNHAEPDVCLATFDVVIAHDYKSRTTKLYGNTARFDEIETTLTSLVSEDGHATAGSIGEVSSTVTRGEYLQAIAVIKDRIRSGDTYQTNLTQQLSILLGDTTPEQVFRRLRRDHPAPFAAFFKRQTSTVVSASPERFFQIRGGGITTSPIKGTRPRGRTPEEDRSLRSELLSSSKDRSENAMIVDLLRNDLGRVCEYGSVRVEKLCDLEEHPTLFHLVSTVSGELTGEATFSDVLRALFPCGSITGAPKISTMRIIDEIEPINRGLSMGAIGYSIPSGFGGLEPVIDLSVAIRTMVFRERVATFNVGGGIVIDSDPQTEYEESLLKAKALLSALNAELPH